MTLTELRYITALARERHFGRAASACFVSQPTLSVAIRKLEEELGVTLFERGPNDVTMTPIGVKVVEQSQRVLEEIDAIREMAKTEQDQLATPLRLGAIYTIAPYLLPSLIPILHKRAPQMAVYVEENYTARLTELLKQGELDVIVISYPFDEPGIVTKALYNEPFVVAMPSKHPWSKRKTIKTEDLADETVLLLSAGNCFRDQVLEACPELIHSRSLSHTMQQTLVGSSLETIRHMVATGMGITVLPCTSTNRPQDQNKLLTFKPFTKPGPTRGVALAWRKRFPRQQALDLLIDAIRATKLECVDWLLPKKAKPKDNS